MGHRWWTNTRRAQFRIYCNINVPRSNNIGLIAGPQGNKIIPDTWYNDVENPMYAIYIIYSSVLWTRGLKLLSRAIIVRRTVFFFVSVTYSWSSPLQIVSKGQFVDSIFILACVYYLQNMLFSKIRASQKFKTGFRRKKIIKIPSCIVRRFFLVKIYCYLLQSILRIKYFNTKHVFIFINISTYFRN